MLDQHGFDLWADGYDKSVGLSEEADQYPFAGYRQVLGTIYDRVLSGPHARVLDIGFGTAVLTAKLYAQGCERAEHRRQRRRAYRKDEAVEQQSQQVRISEQVGVVVEGEALELAQVLAVVEGADEEYDHRRVEEDVDDDGPNTSQPFHSVATPSSPSPVKRFMSQMLMNTSTMRMRLIAAPRFWLTMPLNWRSMISPIIILSVPPSCWVI